MRGMDHASPSEVRRRVSSAPDEATTGSGALPPVGVPRKLRTKLGLAGQTGIVNCAGLARDVLAVETPAFEETLGLSDCDVTVLVRVERYPPSDHEPES